MPLDRRSFLRCGSLLLCGTVLVPTATFAKAKPSHIRILPSGLSLSANDEAVLNFVGSYSSGIRLIGAGVLGRIRGNLTGSLKILACINDLGDLEKALATLPFSGVFTKGNTLSFVLGGTAYTVENLLPSLFAARVLDAITLKKVIFAHDGLTYSPTNHELNDPFDATKASTLLVVRKAVGSQEAVAAILKGLIDARVAGVPVGADFSKWEARILKLMARKSYAQAIVSSVLQRFATLVSAVNVDTVRALLRSRLIASSFQMVFGLSTEQAIEDFNRVRLAVSSDYSDAAVWLSVLIGPEIESNIVDGAALAWVLQGSREDLVISRAALIQARELLNQGATA